MAEDHQALHELTEELGYMSTPVTLIDGEAVVGFDLKRFESLLESAPGATGPAQGRKRRKP